MRTTRIARAVAAAAAVATLSAAAPALAAPAPPGGVPGVAVPKLAWKDCDGGFQCATAKVPRDYAKPKGKTFELALIRLPATDKANRIGSLFMNPGGPGGSGTDLVAGAGKTDFAPLNRRFDLVGFDPRGVPGSKPAVRCLSDTEADARNARPLVTPANLDLRDWLSDATTYDAKCMARNRGVLPYLSTANVVRDLDLLRAAVGDEKLTYVGFSYGTAIGATYASMFGDRARALVLDGAVEADGYFNDPVAGSYDQTKAFERQLGHFFELCVAAGPRCGFGGADPRAAFDALIAKLDKAPLTVGDRKVDGDAIRLAAIQSMYSPDLWPLLAQALVLAEKGDGSAMRQLADYALGRDEDGHYDGGADRFFAIYGIDGAWPSRPGLYKVEGARSFRDFPHFYFNHGYSELTWGLFPVRPRGIYRGPFENPASAPPALVVGTTYDPATPYADAQALTRELGNARLLTMEGDGHTAGYNGSGACVDNALTAFVEAGTLPAEGTVCKQEKQPFPAQPAAARTQAKPSATATRRAIRRELRQLHPAAQPPLGR